MMVPCNAVTLLILVSYSLIPSIVGDVDVFVADLLPFNVSIATGQAIVFVDTDYNMTGFGGYA